MDIVLEEKGLIGLDYQYVGGANVLVLSPVSPANPKLAPTCAVSNWGYLPTTSLCLFFFISLVQF